MSKILGYKIRHTKTGLYLSSLSKNKWTKIGKTWPRKGDAVRAINLGVKKNRKFSFLKKEYDKILDDIPYWELVELSESSCYSALFLLDKLKP